MPKSNGDEPTQETRPKEGEPVEIPIPTRGEIEDALGKIAQPDVSDRKRGPKKK